MAHDYLEEGLQLDSKTGRVGVEIVATLLGGTLLMCALIARFTFDNQDASDLLAMAATLLLGTPLIWVALKDLWQGHMHMNELVALAVLAAFIAGWYVEAGFISFFMIISVLIESRTALGAQASIEALIRITPTKASKLEDGQEIEIEAKDLVQGDIVRVRPGDNIPADGLVASGYSTVNQANITGESLPADKIEGDEVFGGTINLTGSMDIRVTKAGEDATLGQVKDMIQEAERTKIPLVRMIDHYAAWYTPTVVMLVTVVLFLTLGHGLANPWERAISMLVVACPFALILATPTAMVAGLSSSARLGVLVKSVADLEAARNLTAIVFDKTGTLTTGELRVTRLTPADGGDGTDLLRISAAVEQHSKHPVASAVVAVARQAHLALPAPTDFKESAGLGVSAIIDGKRALVGRASWLIEESTADLSPEAVGFIQEALASPDAQGLSLLFAVWGGGVLGWIGLEDQTRPQAAAAMDRLRGLGLKRLIIVTGDREGVAKRVAAAMHTEYAAEVLPQQKLEIVDQLKSKGHRVAVVGDGVNDAPALAAGDISIAMGAAGSDVAIHSANIALMNSNPNRIPFLIELSRKTSAVIKQNLFIGGGFILVFVVLSAANFVTPIMAAVLQLLSGLMVVFNSARLVRCGEEIEQDEPPLSVAASGDPVSPLQNAGTPHAVQSLA